MRLEKFRRTDEATFVTRSHSTYFSSTLANASTYDIGNFNHYLIIFIREKQSLMDDDDDNDNNNNNNNNSNNNDRHYPSSTAMTMKIIS